MTPADLIKDCTLTSEEAGKALTTTSAHACLADGNPMDRAYYEKFPDLGFGIRGKYQVCFTRTGIGTFVLWKCMVCGYEVDISSDRNW